MALQSRVERLLTHFDAFSILRAHGDFDLGSGEPSYGVAEVFVNFGDSRGDAGHIKLGEDVGAGFFAKMAMEMRVVEDGVDGLMKGCGRFEVVEESGAAVVDQSERAGGSSGKDGRASGPGFENDDAEGLGGAAERENSCLLNEADEFGGTGGEAACEQHIVLQTKALDFAMQFLDDTLCGACANEDEHGLGVPALELRKQAHEPWEVLGGVEAGDFDDEITSDDLWKGFQSCRAMIDGILRGWHAVRLDDDALLRILLLEELSFTWIAGEDGVGEFEDATTLHERSKCFSPFKAALQGRGEFFR